MSILDGWGRRVVARREGRVEFLGEKSGQIEDGLKKALILEFATRPDIKRAYLANVGFQPQNERSVALCILSQNPDDQLLVLRIGDIFRRQFGKMRSSMCFSFPWTKKRISHEYVRRSIAAPSNTR